MVGVTEKVSARSPGAGDEFHDEFRAFFQAHSPFAWRVLRRLGVGEPDMDDVMQEVFVVVHVGLGDFLRRSSERTWLYGICVRVASGYRRRAYRRREVPTAVMVEREVPADQERLIDHDRRLDYLDRVLDSLDEYKRAVYVLHELEELPMAEVAKAVGCELKTAYSRYYAGRQRVQALIRQFASGVRR